MYILILVSYALSSGQSYPDLHWPVVTQQEYSSMATCEAAKNAIIAMAGKKISATCKPK